MLSSLFRLVQVLGKRKFLPCQVGGEFPFTLVVDGHAPVVQPILLPHDLHQGLSARSFCLRFSVFGSGNPAVSVSVRFFGLVAASRFGVRVRCFLFFSGVLSFPFFLPKIHTARIRPAVLSCVLASSL